MSVDGCIDDASGRRLILSDAGRPRPGRRRAGRRRRDPGRRRPRIRRDDPRLLVRSAERVAARVAAGRPPQPTQGDDQRRAASSTRRPGSSPRAPARSSSTCRPGWRRRPAWPRWPPSVAAGDPLDPARVLADLARPRGAPAAGRGRHRDAHAVPDRRPGRRAPARGRAALRRATRRRRGSSAAGAFPHDAAHRMRLAEARPVGDLVLLRYLLDRLRRAAARSSGERLDVAGRGDRAVLAVAAVTDGVLGGRADRRRRRRAARRGLVASAEPARPRRGGRLARARPGLERAAGHHAVQLDGAVQRPRVPAAHLHPADPGRGDHPGGVRLARADDRSSTAAARSCWPRPASRWWSCRSWPTRPGRPTSTCSPGNRRDARRGPSLPFSGC